MKITSSHLTMKNKNTISNAAQHNRSESDEIEFGATKWEFNEENRDLKKPRDLKQLFNRHFATEEWHVFFII